MAWFRLCDLPKDAHILVLIYCNLVGQERHVTVMEVGSENLEFLQAKLSNSVVIS